MAEATDANAKGIPPTTDTSSANTCLSSKLDCITADQFRAELAARKVASTALPLQTTASTAEPNPTPSPDRSTLALNQSQLSTWIGMLYECCQIHALPAPVFSFEELEPGKFCTTLSLRLSENLAYNAVKVLAEGDPTFEGKATVNLLEDGHSLVLNTRVFLGKKAGKEYAARKGFGVLDQATKLVAPLANSTTPDSSTANVDTTPKTQENSIGLLLEFAQATANPRPVFTDHFLAAQFACTVTLTFSSNGTQHTETFGSSTQGFATKKAAKAAAAAAAVRHLRALGLMAAPGASLPQQPRDVSTTSAPTDAAALTSPTTDSPDESAAARAAHLATRLGLGSFAYSLTQAPQGPAFWSGAAQLLQTQEPELQGPLGAVSGVYGKRNAKEAIARGVCAVLREFAAARGVDVGAGAGEGEGVVDGGGE